MLPEYFLDSVEKFRGFPEKGGFLSHLYFLAFWLFFLFMRLLLFLFILVILYLYYSTFSYEGLYVSGSQNSPTSSELPY